MNRLRVYLSGPMSGIPKYNRPAFLEAERTLSSAGVVVLNPARNPEGLEYAHYMDISLAMVRSAEIIALLPCADKSPGARAEVAYARSIGLPVLTLPEVFALAGAEPKKGQKKPPRRGRFRAHDSVVFNAHTSKPDQGEFLRYLGDGVALVSLERAGRISVPVRALTRPEKGEVKA